MKHLSKRLVALALSFAMAATMTPVTTQAASKKTVTVSTQAELTKALTTKGISKIIVKTKKAVKFTVKKGKYSAKLEMNAPKATLTNSGTWSGITVTDAKGYTEKAKSNKIVIKDKKLDLTVAKGASAKSVTFAKKGASHNVKINGTVSAVTISSPTTVKITANGTLKKVTVDAKTSLSLSGSSEKKVAMTMTKNAKSSSVKSAVPVSVKASANVAITLKEGAEGSAVAVKSASAKVELTNTTKDTIEVTKADGTKVSVVSGEKADTSKEDAAKEDDKKDEEKKDEEKKPVSGGGGGTVSDGGGNGPSGDSESIGGGSSSEEEDKTPSLTLEKTAVTLSKWDNQGKLKLKAIKKNIDGEIEWLSSDKNKATVDSDGTVTYVATGSAVITASAGGIQATCTVTTTDEVISASGFAAAVEGTDNGTVTLGSDISGEVSATWRKSANLTIDMQNYTLTGNLSLTESGQTSGYNIVLTDNGEQNIGAKITGDLTVNAPSAHVENHIWVQGTSNVEAVANATYEVHDKEEKVLLKGPGKLDIKADKRIAPQVVVSTDKPVTLAGNVIEVSVEKPAEITVDATATVEKIEVTDSAKTDIKTVTVKGAGKVTSLEAKAPVEVAVETMELTAAAPVKVSSGAEVSNVYVESDSASIDISSGVTVNSIAVSNEKAVSKVEIKGAGTVANVDVTNASSDVKVVAQNATITTVVATNEQAEKIINDTANNKITAVKSVTSIEPETAATTVHEIFEGSTPVITGNIKVNYNVGEPQTIAVTQKMLRDVQEADGVHEVSVTYANKSCVFYKYKYKADRVKKAVYETDSMKKLTYTRLENFDPTGAVITLTYDSGKTEQIIDTDQMTFINADKNMSGAAFNKKGAYEIKVSYNGMEAGSQKVTVNPIYYTVSLNANENVGVPGRKETVQVEEFTTLNELSSSGAIQLTATLKPTAHSNRMWKFLKWVKVGDSSGTAYDWNTSIESDLDLIAWWDVITPPEDKITLSVEGDEIVQGQFPVYDVKLASVYDFISKVKATSAMNGEIAIKYGVAGTNGDNMIPYEPEKSTFEVGKRYEILYYTKDGDSYDGNWASILLMIYEKEISFSSASNGIITNCDGMIRAPYGIIQNSDVEKVNVTLKLKSAPEGVDISKCSATNTTRRGNVMYVQFHRGDNQNLPVGTYTLDVTCSLLDGTGKVLSQETQEVSYTFEHAFYSVSNRWNMHPNGDFTLESMGVPYDATKTTVADYVQSSVAAGSTLAYGDAQSEEEDPVFTPINSLADLRVEMGKSYSVRVTNKDGEAAYFIFYTYDDSHSLYVDMNFDSHNVTVSNADASSNKNVSAAIHVESSQDGTYSWLVSNEDLGEKLTIEEYNAYVQECKNYTETSARRIIQLIPTEQAIQANVPIDAPVSFTIPANATGTYYIYLIVHAKNGMHSMAFGNHHRIQVENQASAVSTANQDDVESAGADQENVE